MTEQINIRQPTENQAVEMTLCGKPLRAFHTELGNRSAITTFPPPRRLLHSFKSQTRKETFSPALLQLFRLILRLEKAHQPWRRLIAAACSVRIRFQTNEPLPVRIATGMEILRYAMLISGDR